MTTFVLVPGMCHGGWWYEPLAEALAARGHRGLPVTPTGLGPEGLTGPVNLDTHVQDVLDVCEGEDLVLVGHSYGGVPITCAADRIADRVAGLVYLDALVPQDGGTCFTTTDDAQRRWYVEGAARTGLAVDPLAFFDERAQPHPLATLLQRVELSGAWERVPVKHYVEATDWPDASPMLPTIGRVRDDPQFTFHTWDTRHNVMHDGPQRVLELLCGSPF